MIAAPFRLPADHVAGEVGRLIDRSSRLSFTFDGQAYEGFAGDTLASALLANGVRVVGRSFKFHRPRSFLTAGAEEPNGFVTIGTGSAMTPNERATTVELQDGLVARSQNRWPGLTFDVGQLADLTSCVLPAGFQYKTFMRPAWAWPIYERVLRQAAGNGPAPHARDRDRYEHFHARCDVLVVGGGVAGIAAALAANEAGARVIVAEQSWRFGGASDLFDATIDGGPAIAWIADAAAQLAKSDHAHLLNRTTAFGVYDHNLALLSQTLAPARACSEPRLRERLWHVRAREIVVAAGAVERPLVFSNNDRPGVMTGSAVRAYLRRHGVAPGARAVVFTCNDDGYRTACDLHDVGIAVGRITDARPEPAGPLADAARQRGLDVSPGHAVIDVASSHGGNAIKAALVAALGADNIPGPAERVTCDFVAVDGGWTSQCHLAVHTGGTVAWDEAACTLKPDQTGAHIAVVGAANGATALTACLEEGFGAGEQAAAEARAAGRPVRRKRPQAEEQPEAPARPFWAVCPREGRRSGARQFVDHASDVTVADIQVAVAEGYETVELLKRYTALGMGGDQGKTGNVSGLAVHAEAAGTSMKALGTTTFRPPYTPVSFGAMAGSQNGELFRAVRRSPVWHWHRNHGAQFEPVGAWRRPLCYLRGAETLEMAAAREVRAVRERVGVLDASSLGKIELKGPDAGQFLDLVSCTDLGSLAVGRCRYALMLDEQGYVFDDGVAARLGDDHFLLHTTSGGAEGVRDWLEFWHQTEWPHLRVFITPVDEQWAQFSIAGPEARALLSALKGTIDLSPSALPHFAMATGTIARVPVRIFRISYTGELSFEIAAPANRASALWDTILAAGHAFDLTPIGTEALHILRLEKGYIAIGDETDGTVTPLDLGLERMVSRRKDDFLGKRGLARPDLARADRHQLVGLVPADRTQVLPVGVNLIERERADDEPPFRPIGHITSAGMSATLGHSIALGLVEGGRGRIGESVACPVGSTTLEAVISKPAFLDPRGERLDG